jgi:hypothetical protein
MSAHMVTRAHVLALVRLALLGPSDPRTVSPDNVWHGPRWSALPLADLDGLTLSQLCTVWRGVDWTTCDGLAGLLWDANAASVRYRYADADDVGMVPDVAAFTMADVHKAPALSAVDGLQALAGYEYQSCEHPDWHESEALRFCESLRRSLCDCLTRDSDCWSIPEAMPA